MVTARQAGASHQAASRSRASGASPGGKPFQRKRRLTPSGKPSSATETRREPRYGTDCLPHNRVRFARRPIINSSVAPGDCLQRPDTVLVPLLELLCYLAQHRVIIRSFVVTYRSPVECFGRDFRIRIALKNVHVLLLRFRPMLIHERNTTER
jgi:hypothetical protein